MASNSSELLHGSDDYRKTQRLSETKVYIRKKSNEVLESNPSHVSENLLQTQSLSSPQNLAINVVDVNSSISTPLTPAEAEEENHLPSPPQHASIAPIDDTFSINDGQSPAAANGIGSKAKREKTERRKKLILDLEHVRSLLSKLEARRLQHFADDYGDSLSNQWTPVFRDDENGGGEVMRKQRRIPTPEQYYNTWDPKKMNRTKHRRLVMNKKSYAQAFKKCGVLLSKLMKHKEGWVFNFPVDTVALGLPDYHTKIRHPMDLGTIRNRLCKNLYTNPNEFAEDVRLTFQNAMLYNPKGHDVYAMAVNLLNVFELQWPAVVSLTQPNVTGDVKGKSFDKLEHTRRHLALLKNREMTAKEKNRLASNLENLPEEKLYTVVQILRSRNLALNQLEDGVEVDINNVDTDALWELHRLVSNYKKNLSKKKRKMELASLARGTDSTPLGGEEDKLTVERENNMEDGRRSNSSSKSSSDSSSTATDFDARSPLEDAGTAAAT